MHVRSLLREEGQLDDTVDQWLRKQFVSSVDELAYFFLSSDDIANETPCMAEP